MSHALNGSLALQCFEHVNAVELRNRIMFDFYPGLPHMYVAHSTNNGISSLGKAMDIARFSSLVEFSSLSA